MEPLQSTARVNAPPVSQPARATLAEVVVQAMPAAFGWRVDRDQVLVPIVTPDGRRALAILVSAPFPFVATCVDASVARALRTLGPDDGRLLTDAFACAWHEESDTLIADPCLRQPELPAIVLRLAQAVEAILWCADQVVTEACGARLTPAQVETAVLGAVDGAAINWVAAADRLNGLVARANTTPGTRTLLAEVR